MGRVLVVDDERSMREFLQILLEGDDHEVDVAADATEAFAACRRCVPEVVFTDLKMPGSSGMEVLRHLRDKYPETQVIMITAFGTTEIAVEAMRLGAYDYQTKPIKVEEIRILTQKALEKVALIRSNRDLAAQLRGRAGLSGMVARSPQMLQVAALVEKVAPTRTNVLLEGESGTGKELVARAIHEGSPRSGGPFVPVNCGAIPETLIEAELFGHVSGAFTGASRDRRGLFESANGGTLLLDEIGELPQSMQVKLLRVLQERSVRRVGEERERAVDVRIIAATNRDLQERVAKGSFREDLFYRLNVIRIRLPALRERPEDIAPLAQAFVAQYAAASGRPIQGIAEDALAALQRCPFPGNVRELENYIERAVALTSGARITLADLPPELRTEVAAPLNFPTFLDGGVDLETLLQTFERRYISEALRRADGVKTHAAQLLGLSFRSFRYRLQKLGMADDDGSDTEEPGQPEPQ